MTALDGRPDARHTRDELQESIALAVPALPRVGREWLRAQLQQRRREQLGFWPVRIRLVRLRDNKTLDSIPSAEFAKQAHFLVDPMGFRAVRRAKDDQARCLLQRLANRTLQAG